MTPTTKELQDKQRQSLVRKHNVAPTEDSEGEEVGHEQEMLTVFSRVRNILDDCHLSTRKRDAVPVMHGLNCSKLRHLHICRNHFKSLSILTDPRRAAGAATLRETGREIKGQWTSPPPAASPQAHPGHCYSQPQGYSLSTA